MGQRTDAGSDPYRKHMMDLILKEEEMG